MSDPSCNAPGMGIDFERFVRSQLDAQSESEIGLVDSLANQLIDHLETIQADLKLAHVHNAPSRAIQNLVGNLLEDVLHFEQEVVFPANAGLVVRPRPDFVYRLGKERGIIAEVERGGTTTNNHDLKDIWKAHISSDTQHLFLVVPKNNWKKDGSPREKVFPTVQRRVAAFFGDPRREIDVASAHVFGY